jgi:hypothetical protein
MAKILNTISKDFRRAAEILGVLTNQPPEIVS